MNASEMLPEPAAAAEASGPLVTEAAVPHFSGGERAAPSHDDIARRAYEIYRRKGRKAGQCATNWQQAERELRRQSPADQSAARTGMPNGSGLEAEPVKQSFISNLLSIRGGKGSTRGGKSPAILEPHETH